ncbi:MAG: YcbK family protein [Alphaproteobacteria bacterium]|nr:YcbK family protein [Alphaproteobacteria bacterium]
MTSSSGALVDELAGCACEICGGGRKPRLYVEGHAAEGFRFDGSAPVALGRRALLGLAGLAAFAAIVPAEAATPRQSNAQAQAARQAGRRLMLNNVNTGERFNGVVWANGRFNPASVTQLNRIMRDPRSGAMMRCDVRLYDLLARLQGRIRQPFNLVSGYRSRQTNFAMARASSNVARNSFHTRGMAADIYVEGMAPETLARHAREIGAGGVGLYEGSNFIHIDTGPARSWVY